MSSQIALCIRTDNPQAELLLYRGDQRIAAEKWGGHRQLGVTIHTKIKGLLADQNIAMHDLTKIVVYEGPGSFTGLRIGISVANALSYALSIPVVGSSGDEAWATDGLLAEPKSSRYVQPEYGSDPHITQQKK